MDSTLTKECRTCGKVFCKSRFISKKVWAERSRYCSVQCSAQTRFSKERHFIPPSAIKKGQHLSPETQFKKGLVHGEEWYRAMLGRIPWNRGVEWHEMRRENHPNWKGSTAVKQRLRSCPEYTQWIKSVLKRDNYRCVKCQVNSNKLEVHHIVPFYKIIDDNHIKTYEDGLQNALLWDVNNGKVLCRSCHMQTDSYRTNQWTK